MKMIIVLITAGVLFASSIQASQKIVIAVDWGNPPYMFEQAGEAAGIYPGLISAIFDRMGIEVGLKAYPWKRALKMGTDGEVGIGGIYQTAKRLKIYDYSAPLYTERVLIYVTQKNMFTFNKLADLEGKTIGVLRGWSYGDAFDQFRQAGKVTVKAANNDHITFKRLVAGHVDCLFAPEHTGNQMLRQKAYHDQVVAIAKPVAVNDTYIVFAKRSHKKKLLEQFNAMLKTMKDDGSYEQVIQSSIAQGE